jgi:hypothetical protein
MFIATVAAAILASTTPVAAATTPAPAPAATPAAVNANPRVCIIDTPTGSHLRLRTCKRLNDWRAQGIDPLPKR